MNKSENLLKVEVTGQDIALGWRCSGAACPIARALVRALQARGWQGRLSVRVSNVSLTTYLPHGGWQHFLLDLPPAAKRFIKHFDAGKKVQPFTFLLDRRNAR